MAAGAVTHLSEEIATLRSPAHVCSIVESWETRFSITVPFLLNGLKLGEHCIYYVGHESGLEPAREALRRAHIDADRQIASGALVLALKDRALEGRQSWKTSCPYWQKYFAARRRAGFSGSRIVVENESKLHGRPAIGAWLQYEALARHCLSELGCFVLCQYNRRMSAPEEILHAIRVHPTLIYDNAVCENFFYIPPSEPDKKEAINERVDAQLRNLREHTRATHELKLFRTLIDESNDGIEVVDPETLQFLDINKNACSCLGYSREEMLSMRVPDIDPNAKGSWKARVEDEMKKTGAIMLESVHRRKDGSTFPVEVNLKQVWVGRRYSVAIVRDITDRKEAESRLRQVSDSLLRSHEEERSRIARELHDSALQELLAIKLSLGALRRQTSKLSQRASLRLIECVNLLEQCTRGVRTLSFLLHPPLLEDFGLIPALRGYVEGLRKRSRISIRLEIDVRLERRRLPRDVEINLFRVVQEGLGNVLRHSASKTAHVQLRQSGSEVVVKIRDKGRGIPSSVLQALRKHDGSGLGVGILGMQERARLLGGTLQIKTTKSGTLVTVTVPAQVLPKAPAA